MSSPTRHGIRLILLGLLCLPVACSDIDIVELPGDPVYLTTLNGERFDITYAVVTLGFNPTKFSSSAGPFARPAMMNPVFAKPGDAEYPPPLATNRVIGTRVGDDARAYPLETILRNEVVDDMYGEAPIAVAY